MKRALIPLFLLASLVSAEPLHLVATARDSRFPTSDWHTMGQFVGCVEDGCWPTPRVSQSLESQDDNSYGAASLDDNDITTCWAVRRGPGSWFEYQMPGGRGYLRSIAIINGYAKSPDRWRQNSRIKSLEISVDGSPLAEVELLDTAAVQEISLPLTHVQKGKVRFTVLSVYPGDYFDDLCVSEVELQAPH